MNSAHVLMFGILCVVSLPMVCASTNSRQLAFFACTDYHCDVGKTVTLTHDEWKQVRDLFPMGMSPEEERERIRQAIALLEMTVGAITGTWRDLAGNYAGSGMGGQLDCISESKNTTTYLQLLFEEGLLKWHSIGNRQVRRRFFAPHWTAVIIDQISGEQFAVDSWYLDNGEPPVIQPLGDWLKGVEITQE